MVGEDRLGSSAATRARRSGAAFGLVAAAGVGALLVISAVATAGSVVGGSPDHAVLDQHQLAALAVSGTTRLSARGCGRLAIGTGVLVKHEGSTVIVTNRHLVEGALDAKLDGGRVPVFRPVIARSAEVDLAMAAPVDGLALPLASEPPEAGQVVTLAGHGGGGALVVLEATIHLVVDGGAYGVHGPLLLIDAPTAGGFSGGPVLDEYGHLVAVLQGYEPNLGLSLAVPAATIADFVQAAMTAADEDRSRSVGVDADTACP